MWKEGTQKIPNTLGRGKTLENYGDNWRLEPLINIKRR